MSNNTYLIFADAHDAYDDAAWYRDGRLIGRDSQINIHHDVLPLVSGMTVYYEHRIIPADPDDPHGDFFFWPESARELP